jgi:predicted homoserine dehydrogenase-like protein
VYGKLVPVARSLTEGALPIGLAHGVRLTRDVAAPICGCRRGRSSNRSAR